MITAVGIIELLVSNPNAVIKDIVPFPAPSLFNTAVAVEVYAVFVESKKRVSRPKKDVPLFLLTLPLH
jgi:hypothetical protein